MRKKAPLDIRLILKWADAHRARCGRWPTSRSGPVVDADDGTTWQGVNTALTKGTRGFRGGDSLTRVLRRRRHAVDARIVWENLTRKQILRWVDDHHMRTGKWPKRDSGRVLLAQGISWSTVDRVLRAGGRSLPGGSSLADLLWDARQIIEGDRLLTEEWIIKQALAHHDRTGRWPVTMSGRMIHGPNEDWAAIDMALRHTRRGLQRKTSLSRLLTERFGERYDPRLRPLTLDQILEWADRHERRYGRWPTSRSGSVYGARDLTWSAINYALVNGRRGLRGGTTLAKLLDRYR